MPIVPFSKSEDVSIFTVVPLARSPCLFVFTPCRACAARGLSVVGLFVCLHINHFQKSIPTSEASLLIKYPPVYSRVARGSLLWRSRVGESKLKEAVFGQREGVSNLSGFHLRRGAQGKLPPQTAQLPPQTDPTSPPPPPYPDRSVQL